MLKIRIGAVLILLVGAAVSWFAFTNTTENARFPYQFGLDLAGGTHLVYSADTSGVVDGDVTSAMNSLREVIERRVNIFGVSEPLVQVERGGVVGQGEHRLIVELPGVTDIQAAIQAIGETPLLDFRLAKADLEGNQIFEPTGLTGQFVNRARLEFASTQGGGFSNEPIILLEFNSEGAARFKDITEQNVGTVLGIFLDNQPISTPVIREAIPGGTATISGDFTPESARELVRSLNFGALPVPIELASSQTVGASLGESALIASIQAGLWGFVLVALFILLWYRLPGLVAVIALGLYVSLNLAVFSLIPVTLTVAGLAAFILSIGMAVDANILIFERTKEELASGKNLGDAIREGFNRAWLSIRDSNLSSIITGIILYFMGGTAIIQGFALVFVIGVLISMFTAITVTRTLMMALGVSGTTSKFVQSLFKTGMSI